MIFNIHLSDSEIVSFNESTIIRGLKSLNSDNEDKLFYSRLTVENSFNNILGESSSFGTSDPYVGICGVLGTNDFFQIDGNNSWYKTSSIIKVTIDE